MTETPLGRTVAIAKALANPARLRILGLLEAGESCVCQITAVLGLAPSTVSAHLSDLKRAGLVAERKAGRIVHYRLRDDARSRAFRKAALVAIREDGHLQRDREFLGKVHTVPVEVFCAAGPNWKKLPVFRGSGKAPSRRRNSVSRGGR